MTTNTNPLTATGIDPGDRGGHTTAGVATDVASVSTADTSIITAGGHVRGVDPSTRGRFVAWTGFAFGCISSVAANILHTWLPAHHMPPGWSPGIAPQVGAAVWPIGLLLSVEVLTRVRWQRGWLWLTARFGGAGAVAAGSAVISYSHLQTVLTSWGYDRLSAAVGPLVVDGLMVVCGFALLSMTLNQEITNHPNPVAETTAPQPHSPIHDEIRTDTTVADEAAATDAMPQRGSKPWPPVAAPPLVSHHGMGVSPGWTPPTGHEDTTDDTGDQGVDTRRASALALHARGWTSARIAAELGVSKRTVRRYLSTPRPVATPVSTAADNPGEHTPTPDPSHHTAIEPAGDGVRVESNHYEQGVFL